MRRRIAWSRALTLLVVAAFPAALLLEGGALAFQGVKTGTRAVDASVVAHGSGYIGLTDLAVVINCESLKETWSEVGIVVTNRATTSVTYWVNETADPSAFTTHTPTTGTLAPGAAQSITLTIDKLQHALCHDDRHTATYAIATSAHGTTRGTVTDVVVNIDFSTILI